MVEIRALHPPFASGRMPMRRCLVGPDVAVCVLVCWSQTAAASRRASGVSQAS